jgi:uncharacterized membrane protein YidH (DUF202 family)
VKSIRDGFMPWAGLALGTIGYFLAHQIGSASTFQDCRVGSPLMVIFGAILGLVLIAIGALGSWGVYSAKSETPARKLVAVVGVLACALYVMGVTLPVIAALLIPQCWA